jgi:hypothetical protein
LQKEMPANMNRVVMGDSVSQELDVTLEACKKREKEMEDVMKSARSNYRFKASTNGILVILGTILIANPILFTWLKGFDIIPSLDMDLTDDGNNNLYFLARGYCLSLCLCSEHIGKPRLSIMASLAVT